MRRRNFLTLIGAATLAPVLPSAGAPAAAAAAGYNRYQYGLAVFHARTRAGLSTAELMARLKVNSVQARAMMGEMSASGVLSRSIGTARAATATRPITSRPYVRKAMRQIAEAIDASADTNPHEPATAPETPTPPTGVQS